MERGERGASEGGGRVSVTGRHGTDAEGAHAAPAARCVAVRALAGWYVAAAARCAQRNVAPACGRACSDPSQHVCPAPGAQAPMSPLQHCPLQRSVAARPHACSGAALLAGAPCHPPGSAASLLLHGRSSAWLSTAAAAAALCRPGLSCRRKHTRQLPAAAALQAPRSPAALLVPAPQ